MFSENHKRSGCIEVICGSMFSGKTEELIRRLKRHMYLDSAKKTELFEKFGKGTADTGSAESQIALFSFRIAHLTEHMKQNRKDHGTERALTMLVGKRRALLNYLKKRDINRYRAIVKALGLRK